MRDKKEWWTIRIDDASGSLPSHGPFTSKGQAYAALDRHYSKCVNNPAYAVVHGEPWGPFRHRDDAHAAWRDRLKSLLTPAGPVA